MVSQQRQLQAVWEGYVRAAVPAEPDAAKLLEIRKAFYGGAAATFNLLRPAGRGPDAFFYEDQLRNELLAELIEFIRAVEMGRA